MSDLISRQAAIEALMDEVPSYGLMDDEGNIESGCKDKDVIAMLEGLPSAQPEIKWDEWCTDCKEYDQERHSCPRFNRVIRTALDDARAERNCTDCRFTFYRKELAEAMEDDGR